jgi:ferredoxin
MSWRVEADLDLCQGHQMCQGEAPDVFGFDVEADKVVLLQERPADALRRSVDDAVAYCPAMALAVVPDPDPSQEG